jgi:hypothetical protein
MSGDVPVELGKLNDIQRGSIKVGYVDVYAILSDHTINGKATVRDRPYGMFQLKVEHVVDIFNAVSVTFLDLMVAAEAIREFNAGYIFDSNMEREYQIVNSEELIKRLYRLQRLSPSLMFKVV